MIALLGWIPIAAFMLAGIFAVTGVGRTNLRLTGEPLTAADIARIAEAK